MKESEYKKLLELIVQNAHVNEWEEYTSIVNGCVYKWYRTPPETFVRHLLREFRRETRRESGLVFKYDKQCIQNRQDTLVWLWEHKERIPKIKELYSLYSSIRKDLVEFKLRGSFLRWDDPEKYESLELLSKNVKDVSLKTIGRSDLFYLYDSIPSNWLATL